MKIKKYAAIVCMVGMVFQLSASDTSQLGVAGQGSVQQEVAEQMRAGSLDPQEFSVIASRLTQLAQRDESREANGSLLSEQERSELLDVLPRLIVLEQEWDTLKNNEEKARKALQILGKKSIELPESSAKLNDQLEKVRAFTAALIEEEARLKTERESLFAHPLVVKMQGLSDEKK